MENCFEILSSRFIQHFAAHQQCLRSYFGNSPSRNGICENTKVWGVRHYEFRPEFNYLWDDFIGTRSKMDSLGESIMNGANDPSCNSYCLLSPRICFGFSIFFSRHPIDDPHYPVEGTNLKNFPEGNIMSLEVIASKVVVVFFASIADHWISCCAWWRVTVAFLWIFTNPLMNRLGDEVFLGAYRKSAKIFEPIDVLGFYTRPFHPIPPECGMVVCVANSSSEPLLLHYPKFIWRKAIDLRRERIPNHPGKHYCVRGSGDISTYNQLWRFSIEVPYNNCFPAGPEIFTLIFLERIRI